jgi:hypothetical protein
MKSRLLNAKRNLKLLVNVNSDNENVYRKGFAQSFSDSEYIFSQLSLTAEKNS